MDETLGYTFKGFVFILLCIAVSCEVTFSDPPSSALALSSACLPSYSCQNVCSEAAGDSSSLSNKPTCKKTKSLGTDSSLCQCRSTSCLSVNSLCLRVCKKHTLKEIKTCASCINATLADAKDRGVQVCGDKCHGICVDACEHDAGAGVNCSTCVPGFYGDLCQRGCSPGCVGACQSETGNCLDCPAGNYGPQCKLTCPSRCLNGSCHPESGVCDVCPPGSTGDACNETCPEGLYGEDCSVRCSPNCRAGTCDAKTGYCPEGCKPGYFSPRCNLSCPAKTYGKECLSECPVTCADGIPCNHVTGVCVSGCDPGFHGPLCNLTCPVGKFGANCSSNCSKTCFRELCNAFSGICLTCVESFYGPLCEFNVNIDKIKPGVLGSEVSPQEAIMMILGISLLGVLMWVAVAYLLLHQRRRILKDAARGIDPRNTQWGMFPNSRGFRRAVRLYDKKWASLAGGDVGQTSKRKRHEDYERPPRSPQRRRGRLSKIARIPDIGSGAPPWWRRSEAEKPKLPDANDVGRVAKWLARHHGATQVNTGATRIAESKPDPGEDVEKSLAYERVLSDEVGSLVRLFDENDQLENVIQKPSETLASEERKSTSQASSTKPSEKPTTQASQSQTGQEATSLPSVTHRSKEEASAPSYTQAPRNDMIQPESGEAPSYEDAISSAQIRRASIFLSPRAHPGGPSTPAVYRVGQNAGRDHRPRDARLYQSDTAGPTSTSSRDTTTVASATFSTTERTTSSTYTATRSSDGSSSSTAADSDLHTQTRTSDTETTSTETTSGSYSSDDTSSSGDSSTSTVLSRHKSNRKQDRGSLQRDQTSALVSTKSASETTKPATKDADTDTTSDKMAAPSLLQKLVGVFKRSPGSRSGQRPAQPVPEATTSVPGAGGLHRPYSHKFMFTRLETWHRNRGLEVKVKDGVMEVAGGQSDGPGARHPDVDPVTAEGEPSPGAATDETSWSSTLLSDSVRGPSKPGGVTDGK